MSLNFKLDKIQNFKTLCFTGEEGYTGEDTSRHLQHNIVTQALIWGTMSVDLGEITEKNAVEFAQRLRAVEIICGAMIHRPEGHKGSAYITAAEVKSHIGLSTNVSTTTRAAFDKKLAKMLRDRVMREIINERDAAGNNVLPCSPA